ncbi:transglycosylase SLT domain-containing protein [Nocardia sp. NPDC050710]|uniref:transglycosylase SLT domain-containing protein n=1 Tax=Nocardia sp. NPDC050710 TaxID=3157220 RepID=UPI0034117391
MTLSIDDVAKWEPDHLATAGTNAHTMFENLDTAVRKGVDDTADLGTGKVWSGAAAAAANARMETEKTRASEVSKALGELETAFSTRVGNLKDTKQKVLQLRDAAQSTGPCRADSDKREPGFVVSSNGDVSADNRIQWYKDNLNEHEANQLSDQARKDAAQFHTDIVNALAAAQQVADDATRSVQDAVKKLEAAFNGLGDPNADAAAATKPTNTAPVTTTSRPSNSSKPNYVMGNHSGSSSGSSSGGSSSAPTGPMPTGDVAKWIEDAKKVLIEMGYDPKDIDERAIAMIIQHESGGNPYAENRWDSNWAAGHPSKGIMQTIDSTFNAYKAPGHDDIWNPVDNIVAAVRYSIDTYGSVDNVPGIVAMNSGGAYQGY